MMTRHRHRGNVVGHSVYNAPNGKHYTIVDAPGVGILKSLGVSKNNRILKKQTYGFGGPVLLMVETSEIAIGKDIADKIIVKEAD